MPGENYIFMIAPPQTSIPGAVLDWIMDPWIVIILCFSRTLHIALASSHFYLVYTDEYINYKDLV